MHFTDCIVLHGPELRPFRCASFRVEEAHVVEIDLVEPVQRIESGARY